MQIQFWFDFASPYAYVASERIETLARSHGATVDWCPLLLGVVLKRKSADGSPFQRATEAEHRYRRRDIERLCIRNGLPLVWPTGFPRGSLLAMRTAYVAREQGWGREFANQVFRANFVHDRDIAKTEVVADLIEACKRPSGSVLELAQSEGNKKAFLDHVEQAIARGIFGVPTVVVGDELFWATTSWRRRSSGSNASPRHGRSVAVAPWAIAYARRSSPRMSRDMHAGQIRVAQGRGRGG